MIHFAKRTEDLCKLPSIDADHYPTRTRFQLLAPARQILHLVVLRIYGDRDQLQIIGALCLQLLVHLAKQPAQQGASGVAFGVHQLNRKASAAQSLAQWRPVSVMRRQHDVR